MLARTTRAMTALWMGLCLATCLGGGTGTAALAAGIHVGLTPASSMVPEDTEFDLDLSILVADAHFNGYDAVIEFDPAMLTFLPTVPTSLQEGALMTGACGNTFHRFNASADSMVINHVLLCAGVALTGPGQLYKLRFKAGFIHGDTQVRIRPLRTKFYDAGLFVFPVETFDANVYIGNPVDVGPAPDGAPVGVSLRAQPNPSRTGTTLLVSSGIAAPQTVSILDAKGRRVRDFGVVAQAAGETRVTWDGRDDRGRPVAAGVYQAVLGAGGRRAVQRLTIVP
ncbi:MAG: FlgD immunoglobulin-like domain containing protein [Candidatus Eiseniibacteriota bacterium]